MQEFMGEDESQQTHYKKLANEESNQRENNLSGM